MAKYPDEFDDPTMLAIADQARINLKARNEPLEREALAREKQAIADNPEQVATALREYQAREEAKGDTMDFFLR